MVLGSKIPEGIGLILETYRSGHNGPDSKSVGRLCRLEGSNPSVSVKKGLLQKEEPGKHRAGSSCVLIMRQPSLFLIS